MRSIQTFNNLRARFERKLRAESAFRYCISRMTNPSSVFPKPTYDKTVYAGGR
jgi:hypothetical protein